MIGPQSFSKNQKQLISHGMNSLLINMPMNAEDQNSVKEIIDLITHHLEDKQEEDKVDCTFVITTKYHSTDGKKMTIDIESTEKIPFDFGQICMFNKCTIQGLRKNLDVEFDLINPLKV